MWIWLVMLAGAIAFAVGFGKTEGNTRVVLAVLAFWLVALPGALLLINWYLYS